MTKDWVFEEKRNAIVHSSGFEITFAGDPDSSFFTGMPRKFPSTMSNMQVTALIREGFDYFRIVYKNRDKRPILTLKAGHL